MAVIEKFYHFGTTFRINKTPYYKWCINVADPEKQRNSTLYL